MSKLKIRWFRILKTKPKNISNSNLDIATFLCLYNNLEIIRMWRERQGFEGCRPGSLEASSASDF
jgi:hypothetical protein